MSILLGLPEELVLKLAEACGPEMHRFTHVSKQLYRIVDPELYKYNVRHGYSSAMFWAAKYGNLNTLEYLREAGAEWNDQSASYSDRDLAQSVCPYQPAQHQRNMYFSPLHIAAKFGQDGAVRWLLKHGARIDAPALNLCTCQHGISPLGRGLADSSNAGFDIDLDFDPALSPLCTPLHIAVCNGQKSTARLLLSLGAVVEACRSSHSDKITNILHTAARCNDATTIRYVVQRGLVHIDSFNESLETAIHCAALHEDDTSALTELISLGANVDAQAGSTAFAYACDMGNFKAALILLNCGLRLFGREESFLPLHHAIHPRSHFAALSDVQTAEELEAWEQDRETFIRLIVSGDPALGGFNINDLDSQQRPVLFVAASHRATLRTLELLIDLGANIDAQDKSGVTAIQEILRRGDHTTTASIACLLRRGARMDLKSDTLGQRRRVHGFCALDTALLATDGDINHPVLYSVFQHASEINFAKNFMVEFVEILYSLGRHEDCQLMMIHGIKGAPFDFNREWLKKWMLGSIIKRDLTQIGYYLAQFPTYLMPRTTLRMVLIIYDRKYNARQDQDQESIEDDIINTLLARIGTNPGRQQHGLSNLLHLACKNHHIKIIPRLLEIGCQVDILDEDFHTPLFHAVAVGCPHTVKLLLEYGADAFQRPSEAARINGMKYDPATEHPPNDQSAFQTAITRSHKEVDFHFFRSSCYIDYEDASLVDIIIRHRGLPPFPTDPGSLTYIHEALKSPKALKVLLKRGADPNAGHIREHHPLLYACQVLGLTDEVLESIALLVSHGARIDETHQASGQSFLGIVKEAHEAIATHPGPARGCLDPSYFQAQCSLMRLLQLTKGPVSGQSVIKVRHAKRWMYLEVGKAPEESSVTIKQLWPTA